MTTTQKDALILKNQAGDYFVLPLELIERGRIAADHRSEIDHLFATSQAHDTAGHAAFLPGVFVGLLLGGGVSIATIAWNLSNQSAEQPNWGGGWGDNEE